MTSVIDNIYIDNDCKHGDTVQYRVRAVAKDGRCSAWSMPASIWVGDNNPPEDPILTSVTAGYAGCLLQWLFPSDPDYSFTEIFRQTVNSGQSGYYNGVLVSSLESTDYRMVDTKRAEESFICGDIDSYYCFKIRHVDTSGNKSNFSNVLCSTTRGIKPTDVDKTPGEPRIYYTPTPGIVPAEDVYITQTDTSVTWWPGGTMKDFVNFVKGETDGLRLEQLNTKADIVNTNRDIDIFKVNTGNAFNDVRDKINSNEANTRAAVDELLLTDARLTKDIHDNFINDDLNKKLLDTTAGIVKAQGLEQEAQKGILDNTNLAIQNIKDQNMVRDNLTEALKKAIDANTSKDEQTAAEAKRALDDFRQSAAIAESNQAENNRIFNDALNTLKEVDKAQTNATNELKDITNSLKQSIINNELGDGERKRILDSALQTLDELKLKDRELEALNRATDQATKDLRVITEILNNNERLTAIEVATLQGKIPPLNEAINSLNRAVSENTLANNNNAKVINDLTPIVNDTAAKVTSVTQTANKNQEDLTRLKNQANELQQAINENRSTNQAGLDDLRGKITGLENAIRTNKFESEEQKQQLANQLANYQGAVDAALATALREIDILKRTTLNTDTNLNNYINSNEQYKTSVDALIRSKVDQEALNNAVRDFLKVPDARPLFEQFMNETYKQPIQQAGITAQDAQTKAEWLMNNVGTPAIVDFSKWIALNPDWKLRWDQFINTTKLAQENKLKIQELSDKYNELKTATDQIISQSPAIQESLTKLGLDNADTRRQLGVLIQNDADYNNYFSNKINELTWKSDHNLEISAGLRAELDYGLFKGRQKDFEQDARLNSHDTKINELDTKMARIEGLLPQLLSDFVITSPNGTLQGAYGAYTSSKGLKTIWLNIDVNSSGLVDSIKQNFVIKENVNTSVHGQIVGSS